MTKYKLKQSDLDKIKGKNTTPTKKRDIKRGFKEEAK